jgi:phosphoenolpyruvate carboxykinase (ATP)
VPRDAWPDKAAYDATARKLAGLFTANFAQYAGQVTPDVAAAGPAT